MALATIEYVGGPYCGNRSPVEHGSQQREIRVPLESRPVRAAPGAEVKLRIGRYRLNHTDHRGNRPVHVYEWMGEE
jgi:hypothetical protein